VTGQPLFNGQPRPDLEPTDEPGTYRDAHGGIYLSDDIVADPEPQRPAPAVSRLRPRGVDLARVAPFKWAWDRRLLLGYLNILVGDEGTGKGTLLCWLIAKLTKGGLPGDLDGKPARVLVVGDEDGFDGVWVPRLIAAGADLDLVLDLPTDDNGQLDLAADADALKHTLLEHQVDVVIFDQLLDNLPSGVDPWKDKAVRDALKPARRVFADTQACAIATLHTNKSNATTFRQRISGTQAFNALSRSSLLLAEHPDDEDRRLLIRGKGNYAAPPPAVEFRITSVDTEIGGHVHKPTKVVDVATSRIDIAEVLGAPERVSKAQIGRDTIADALADGEWHDATPIRAELAAAGLSDSGIKRAGNDLGIERRRTNGFPSHDEWRLPNARAHAQGAGLTDRTDRTGRTADASTASTATPASAAPPARSGLVLVDASPEEEQRIAELIGRHNGGGAA